MANGIWYGGYPVLVDVNRQVATFLDQWLDRECNRSCPHIALGDERTDDRSRTVRPVHTPRFNYPPDPKVGINQLWWPSGATRWARAFFLVDQASKDAIVAAAHPMDGTTVALDLNIEANGTTLSTKMFLLSPRQVTAADPANAMWLLPLVDERYFWQFTSWEVSDQPSYSWSGYFDQITLRLPSATVAVLPGVYPADYLVPDEISLKRISENVAVMVDAFAASLGRRVVRDFDGTVQIVEHDESNDRLDDNQTAFAPTRIAGGWFARSPHPRAIRVVFRQFFEDTCQVAGDGDNYWITARPSDSSFLFDNKEPPITLEPAWPDEEWAESVHVVHSTAYATFPTCTSPWDGSTPTNQSQLQNLTQRIATDYLAGTDHQYDVTAQGLVPWEPTGFDDGVMFTLGVEHEPVYSVANLDDGVQLQKHCPRFYHTRAISLPEHFAARHQLSQTMQVKYPFAPWIEFTLADDLATTDAEVDGTVVTNIGEGICAAGTVKLENLAQTFSGTTGATGLARWIKDDRYKIVQMECP